MTRIEKLMSEYPDIEFRFDDAMPLDSGGFTVGHKVIINENINEMEQYQWLLEELGHINTSVGDISDYSANNNMRDELVARTWGYRQSLTEEDINHIKSEHPETDYEIADDLGLQLPYLHEVGFTYGLRFKHASD